MSSLVAQFSSMKLSVSLNWDRSRRHCAPCGLLPICRVNVVVVQDFRVPVMKSDLPCIYHVIESYIMIFQVSIGRSASLNDQSNFSSATGSSVGS